MLTTILKMSQSHPVMFKSAITIILTIVFGLIIIGISFAFKKKAESEQFTQDPNVNLTDPSNQTKIYNFNTSWCGWSKRFQPQWDGFAEYAKDQSNGLKAIDVKCDDPANESMCSSFEVPGYPYVVVEKNGTRTVYQGDRTTQALITYAQSLN